MHFCRIFMGSDSTVYRCAFLIFDYNSQIRQFHHRNLIAGSNIYSVDSLMVPKHGIIVAITVNHMREHLNLQNHQVEMNLMPSFPYLAGYFPKPDCLNHSEIMVTSLSHGRLQYKPSLYVVVL